MKRQVSVWRCARINHLVSVQRLLAQPVPLMQNSRADSANHLMQPRGQRAAAANAARFPSQGEKSRLERILGVGSAAKAAASRAEDHRTMPPHQHFERGLIARLYKPGKQVF